MLLAFFSALRAARVPVSLREHLTLVDALAHGLAEDSVDTFYGLARTCLVKDERHLDAFDRTFAACFQGASPLDVALESRDIPEDWLRSLGARYLDDADRASLEALGWDRLMATLRERLREQKERHEVVPNGSAPAARRPSAPTASIPKASASATRPGVTAARPKSGRSVATGTSPAMPNSARAR